MLLETVIVSIWNTCDSLTVTIPITRNRISASRCLVFTKLFDNSNDNEEIETEMKLRANAKHSTIENLPGMSLIKETLDL